MEEKSNTEDHTSHANKPSAEFYPVETMLTGMDRPKWRDYSQNQNYNLQQQKYELLHHFSKTTILKKLTLPLFLFFIAIIALIFVNRQQTLEVEKLEKIINPIPTPTTQDKITSWKT
jgi:hypothetical protein